MAATDLGIGRRDEGQALAVPSISLPKGGGAIRGLGEKFAANPVTGTGSLSVPIATSPSRSGFAPQLALSYDSAAGNGPFGFGWTLALPSITRKTDKGLPQYDDAGESDVFLLSGAEDLVPELKKDPTGAWVIENGRHVVFEEPRTVGNATYRVRRYHPRVEGLFARIERWTHTATGEIHWRSISRDNVTTLYGQDNNSRIFDPADPTPEHPTRIFSWLVCASYDDKGNAIVYKYAAENDTRVDRHQANERNRLRTANRYLKRILYGNRVSRLVQPDLAAAEWMFEVVLDYGDHDPIQPRPRDDALRTPDGAPAWPWTCRQDPFSSYRAGFEVRTYRLCRRVLMFHHFPGEPSAGADCLVRSTDFTYSPDQEPTAARGPVYTFLAAITQTGYQRQDNGYLQRSLPPLEFEYAQPAVQNTVATIDAGSLENLPAGLDGAVYQWTDLHGEGLPGLLTEQAGAWFYKRNLSPIDETPADAAGLAQPKLAAVEIVGLTPTLTLASGAQLMDLAGDGQPDLVMLDGPMAGLYEHDDGEGWQPFRPFTARLNRSLRDPMLKLVDLDGDGRADVLIGEDGAFVWHPSLAEAGFGPARRVAMAPDEETGPRLIFADDTQSVYLADLSGDGLTDLVRIRNGEVCYWPNLGYGRFGAKVTMDHAPGFDAPDQFDQKRIRLADVDGSGTADLIYLHRDGVRLYFNQSGNAWSEPHVLPIFPSVDALATIVPIDLLGNGTACLVWSSPLPGDAHQPMRYVSLMGGQKPHLLVKTKNNLGAETFVQYAASTKFYLQDKAAGQPWITRLPFPVHVVEKVTATDRWRGTTFTTSYSYHHGYFDGDEREFRGFGRVEQVDVETYGRFAAANAASPYVTPDQTLYQPPVKTVTWYHTGAFLDRARILSHYAEEYFPAWFEALQPGQQVLGGFRENHLPEPDLAALDLSADEWRQALRACKGMALRQEVYELDVDALAAGRHKPVKLFSTANHTCHIRLVQPQAGNPHAVFLVAESEAITYHYELDLRPETLAPDPRIAHTLNLSIDEYGNVQQTVGVVYPRVRKHADATLRQDALALIRHVQDELHLAYTETRTTNDILDPANYRLRLPCETLTYELTGIKTQDAGDATTPADPVDDFYFTLDELRAYKLGERYQKTGLAVEEIPYHRLPDRITPQKRLVEHTCTLFFKPSLDAPEPLGTLNPLALPYETYTLALTGDLLALVFGDKLQPGVLDQLADKRRSGYLSGQDLTDRLGAGAAGQFWRCSGVAGFDADAPQHFYLPERYTDPFGNPTTLSFDSRDLFIQSSDDALGNHTEIVAFDYRVLAPQRLKDMNGNLSEVRFDALGMPVVTAVLGKGGEGDNLDGFDEAALNPDETALASFFVAGDYAASRAKSLLAGATARHLYFFGEAIENGQVVWGKHPPCAAGIVREQHLSRQADSPVQAAFEYSDGAGNILVKKVQAEPEQPNGLLRWIASGKTVLNNKGKPVKQYEPYFSPPAVGHRFEDPAEIGVTPVISYDAAGRVVRTDAPDGSYSRVEFGPWQVTAFDRNDTVLEPGNAWFARASASARAEERRAAALAAGHANTPAITLLDSLGREVISVAHNRTGGVDEKIVTFTRLDAEGKPLWLQDGRGNRVLQTITPPLPDAARPFDDPPNLQPQGFAPCYDIAGTLLFQHSMDAGDRWMLADAASQPMVAWNSRGFITQVAYDALHRPTGSFVIAAGDTTLTGAPRDPQLPADPPVQFEKLVYGESHPEAIQRNLRGKRFEHCDTAGKVTTERYDFEGNPLASRRQLLVDYQRIPDWSQNPPLEAETFTTRMDYDALNRPITIRTPDNSLYRPSFNAAGLLERVDVALRGALANGQPQWTAFVENVDYNAKGQRERIAYGNGAATSYIYDDKTFRLAQLKTTRPAHPDATASTLFADATVVQDLRYTYDPEGNITRIADAAHKTIFCANQQVAAAGDYAYDALYRLIAASGRERLGATQHDWDDAANTLLIPPNTADALGCYVETYRYDAAGNIVQMVHHAGSSVEQPGAVAWNRRYRYAEASNRLLATSLPGDPDGAFGATYSYDPHGAMTRMPHLPAMRWDFQDRLAASAQQVVAAGTPETTTYVYDAAGQRVRKVTESQAGVRRKERIYLGGCEIYREYGNGAVSLERQTLQVMDDKQRIALVETQTGPAPGQPLLRYQMSNHLGSASLELDGGAGVIDYEEYTPYGSTAYCAGRSAAEVSLKRYRYTGKERDEETGLAYHGARYYAPWLARWTSADPIGTRAGANLYQYVRNRPLIAVDLAGTVDHPPKPDPNADWVQNEIRRLAVGTQAGPALELQPDGTFRTIYRAKETIITAAEARGETPPAPTPPQEPPPEPDHRFGFYPMNKAEAQLDRQATEAFKGGRYLEGMVGLGLKRFMAPFAMIENLMPYNIPDHFLSAGQYAKRWIWYDMRGQSGKGLLELGKGHVEAASLVGSLELSLIGLGKVAPTGPSLKLPPEPPPPSQTAPKTWQDFMPAAQERMAESKLKYGDNQTILNSAGNTTRLGVPRDNVGAWRDMLSVWDEAGYGDMVSETNRGRLNNGQIPVVDEAWVAYFPEHAADMGKHITPHHVGGLPFLVFLSRSEHLAIHYPGGFRWNPGWIK